MEPSQTSSIAKARKSRSADAAKQAEMARLRQMTVEERIRESLTMGEKYQWLKPVRKEP
jgi:hypothetical protein